jgi:hypothetical protein
VPDAQVGKVSPNLYQVSLPLYARPRGANNLVSWTTSFIPSFAIRGRFYERSGFSQSNCKAVRALVLTIIEDKETTK